MVRGKFKLTSATEIEGGSKTLKLQAIYDTSIPEDQRYATHTPSGTIDMHVTNPGALEQFKVGQSYYIDFTPVPEPVKA